VCCLQELDAGYRKIWDFGRSWDPDAYAAQPRSLSEIRRDLVLQRNWKASLDRMKTNMAVGCLQVGSYMHSLQCMWSGGCRTG
jgi:hypothetical protein